MYSLIARVPDALGSLKQLLLDHIYNQGLSTIEKCGETAINVCKPSKFWFTFFRIQENIKCYE